MATRPPATAPDLSDDDSYCSEDLDKLTSLAKSEVPSNRSINSSTDFNENGLRRFSGGRRPSLVVGHNIPSAPLPSATFHAKKVDFFDDPKSQMTYGRRIGLYLMNRIWYNPQLRNKKEKDDEENTHPPGHEAPSLAKAWAYFEHFTLPRHIFKPEHGKYPRSNLEYARAGEDTVNTRLYSPIWTHINQMGDFGIGIGLYFSALRAMFIITILAGFISLPNILYYSSDHYSNRSSIGFQLEGKISKSLNITGLSDSITISTVRPGLETMLQGSAVCSDTSWVPCPTCTKEQFALVPSRFRTSKDGLNFVLKNNCDAPPLKFAIINLCTFAVLAIGYMLMSRNQSKMCITFDEDEQTAQDYSIQIHNPPGNAHDPNEWVEYFLQFDAKVTCLCICLNNDILVKALVERRERYLQLTRKLPLGTSLDDNTVSLLAAQCERDRNGLTYFIATILHPFYLMLDIAALYSRIVVLTSKIRGLSQLENPVSNVFVTFETEKGQRNVLTALDCGIISARTNNAKAFYQASHLFRRRQVLQISEPEEPSTIRWQDLNANFSKKVRSLILTFILTLCLNVLTSYIVKLVDVRFGYYGSAVTIALANIIFPEFCKMITKLEPHKSESDYETSLLVKIAFFRFVNTAIVIHVIVPFPYYLSTNNNEALLPLVYVIQFADIFISSAVQLIDPVGHFKRHFLGPREINQEFMNKRFQGTVWHLAERYTNMTKVIFHSFYYCTLFPAGLFMCAGALFVNYYVDKFCVMRVWARAPRIGTSIGQINQNYIIPLSLLAMIIMSSYWWASFPYDNLCGIGTVDGIYEGTYLLLKSNQTDSLQILFGNETMYKYCHQNLIFPKTGSVAFPVLSSWQGEDKWMTKDQELTTNIFGIASAVVLAVVLLKFLWSSKKYYVGFFRGNYEPSGKIIGINYSDVREISCYIPQVSSSEFSYPLIVSCVDDVATELYEWKDPDKTHAYYNVMSDASAILFDENSDDKLPDHIFSRVYHYPPASKSKELVFDGEFSKDSVTGSYSNIASSEANSSTGRVAQNKSSQNKITELDSSIDLGKFN